MTRPTAVVAIGGHALIPEGEEGTIYEQFAHTRESLVPIVELACLGWNVAVVHGNGPQVGNALLRNEKTRRMVPELPLGVLVASTAGWIGYMIQQSLRNALDAAAEDREVVTVITQVTVDRADESVMEPRKFIGLALDAVTAEELQSEGTAIGEDARGRQLRRVASPPPVGIVEARLVERLLAEGAIVIAAGGGGVPVWREQGGGLEGLDVVIDKDLAASLLAREVGAAILVILTDVDGVYQDYGGPAQRRLDRLSVAEAELLLMGNELGEGSMEPKVRAAMEFVASGGERAIIAALTDASAAMDGRAGTVIVP